MKFFCLNVLAFVMLFSITTNSFSLRLQSKDNLKGSSVNLFDHIEKYEEYIIQRRHKLISWSLQAFFAVDTAISNGENNVRVTGYAGLTSFCKSDIDKYLQLPSSQYNDYGVMFFSNSKSTSEPNISGVIDGVSETAIMARMKRDDLLILAGLVKVDKQYSQWSSTSGTYQDLPGSTTYKPIIYSTFMDIGMSFLANEISSIEQFNLGYKFHIIDNYFEAGPKFTYYEIDSTVQLGVEMKANIFNYGKLKASVMTNLSQQSRSSIGLGRFSSGIEFHLLRDYDLHPSQEPLDFYILLSADAIYINDLVVDPFWGMKFSATFKNIFFLFTMDISFGMARNDYDMLTRVSAQDENVFFIHLKWYL